MVFAAKLAPQAHPGNGDSDVMLPVGRGRGFCGQIGTTGTSGNGDSDVMLPVGRGRGFLRPN